jgi:hypothetical protein
MKFNDIFCEKISDRVIGQGIRRRRMGKMGLKIMGAFRKM